MSRQDLSELVRPHMRDLEAYTPIVPFEVLSQQLGRAPAQIVKLDANENPYGPLPAVREALASYPFLHIYPDPEQRELREALAGYAGVPAANIMVGQGADELIDLICRIFLGPGDAIVDCPPTFGMYSFDAGLAGARVIRVPRLPQFAVDVAAVEGAVLNGAGPAVPGAGQEPTPLEDEGASSLTLTPASGGQTWLEAEARWDDGIDPAECEEAWGLELGTTSAPPVAGDTDAARAGEGTETAPTPHRGVSASPEGEAGDPRVAPGGPGPKLLFLTSPNNPDGGLLDARDLSRILELPVIVVLDEAYIEFAGLDCSVARWVRDHTNLIVLRTFSKWAGIAGLRLGYGIFPDWLMPFLWRAKQPYNVNVAATVAGLASLQHRMEIEATIDALVWERNRLYHELAEIPFLRPYPSRANFVLCRVIGRDAGQLKARLAQQGVLVRHYARPGLENYIRISAGRPQDTEALLAALRRVGG